MISSPFLIEGLITAVFRLIVGAKHSDSKFLLFSDNVYIGMLRPHPRKVVQSIENRCNGYT